MVTYQNLLKLILLPCQEKPFFEVTAATRKKIVKTPPAYLLVEADWLQSDSEEAKPFVDIYINQHSLVFIGW